MKTLIAIAAILLIVPGSIVGQSASFKTYINPVIPGDHPDCTLTKVGNDYYTAGSSFNPTPVIYHSTDLVHWEAVGRPVNPEWSGYGDAPAGGCWGGQIVHYGGSYWYFFSRSNVMHFTVADTPSGPWTLPTAMSAPAGVPGLGYDNSIFIDDDGSWFLLVKNGQENNWIVELGSNGQPAGRVLDLRWINPAPTFPFSWAEGPVMWKYLGKYYYCFGRNVAGGQIVFRSDTLTDNQNAWTNLGNFFDEGDPLKGEAQFRNPNHASAVVMLDDSTHWVVHPLWRSGNNNEWYGQGRQGLLNQVRYNTSGKPTADYPTNVTREAPRLPSNGIPWMVPHSDFFDAPALNAEWSFLGQTPSSSYSLSQRPGWLRLSPRGRRMNTVVKNDGEHNYTLMTRVDCVPVLTTDQAGLWVFNGLQTLFARLFVSVGSSGGLIVGFGYRSTVYQVDTPRDSSGAVWLKLERWNHNLTGYCSSNGSDWVQVGGTANVRDMDGLQPDYNAWTGNRQGLYVQGASADFDFYVYRDAYSWVMAGSPANQSGTGSLVERTGWSSLTNIQAGDWALYAGVEFGHDDYRYRPDSLVLTASSSASGGVVEVWLDSIDTGTKITECPVGGTGSWETLSRFASGVSADVTGNHDVYLRFDGSGSEELFRLQFLTFTRVARTGTSVFEPHARPIPDRVALHQNYPNPFNPETWITYTVPRNTHIVLKVFNILGEEVASLWDGYREAGTHAEVFDGAGMPSGVYFYQIRNENDVETRQMIILR